MKKTPRPDAALRKKLVTALPVAITAAYKAGELIRSKFGRFGKLDIKADSSPVTEVDRRAERIVTKILHASFPTDHVLGEEGGATQTKGASAFRWHIDPLDGTTNFIHGFPFFCVSIGLEFEDSEPVLGVIYQPMTDQLYTAIRGGGAFRDKKRIHVSKTPKLLNALLSTGFSMKRRDVFRNEMGAFAEIAGASHAVRRTGSAALDLAHVATGQFDGFWERGLSSWDMAAGLALLQEAGGTFSRMDGQPFQLTDDSVLASNGRIHAELVRAAKKT